MLKNNWWMAGAALVLLGVGLAATQSPTEPPSMKIQGNIVIARPYWLGVDCVRTMSALRTQLNLRGRGMRGLLVAVVAPDSPAAKAGIARHDVLLRAGDKPLNCTHDLTQAVKAARDSKLKIELIRGGKPQTIEVTPCIRPTKIGGKSRSLPPNTRVVIDLGRNKPARIVVERDGKKQEFTGNNLHRLPGDVRPCVEQVLSGVSGSGRIEVTGPIIRRSEAKPAAKDADWEEDWETVQKWLEGMMSGQGGGDLQSPAQFRFLHPGAIVPKNVLIPPKPLPANLSVVISKEGNQPAKIVVKRDNKKWELTEKELKKLPANVRPYVERMLGRQLEGIIITSGHTRVDASDKTSQVQQSLNLTNSRLRKLERRLAERNRNTVQKTQKVQLSLDLTNSQLRQMEKRLDERNRNTAQKTQKVQRSLDLTNSQLGQLKKRLDERNRNTVQKTQKVQRSLDRMNSRQDERNRNTVQKTQKVQKSLDLTNSQLRQMEKRLDERNRNTAQKTQKVQQSLDRMNSRQDEMNRNTAQKTQQVQKSLDLTNSQLRQMEKRLDERNRNAAQKTQKVQKSLDLTNSQLRQMEKRLDEMNRNTAQKTQQFQQSLDRMNSRLKGWLDEINRQIDKLFKLMNKKGGDRDHKKK